MHKHGKNDKKKTNKKTFCDLNTAGVKNKNRHLQCDLVVYLHFMTAVINEKINFPCKTKIRMGLHSLHINLFASVIRFH